MRRVVLSGNAAINIILGNVDSYEGTVKSALQFQGWSINTVIINKALLYTNSVNILIDANVDDLYSAEQARQNAIVVLQSIPTPDWSISNLLFSGVSMEVVSDAGRSTGQPDTTQNTTITKLLSATDSVIKETAKSAFSPTAIAVIAIAGIFILKGKI